MMFTHKNLMTVCCAAVLAFGLAACGSSSSDDDKVVTTKKTTPVVPGETVDPAPTDDEIAAATKAAGTKADAIGEEAGETGDTDAGLGGSTASAIDAGDVGSYALSIERDRMATSVTVTVNGATDDDDVEFMRAMDFGDGRTKHVRDNGMGEEEVVIVSTDIDAPTATPFAEVDGQGLNTNPAVDGGANQSLTINDVNVGMASSANFPSTPGTTRTYPEDSDTTEDMNEGAFAGTFNGAPGTFECESDNCSIRTDSDGDVDQLVGTWHFTPDPDATSYVADAKYLHYGFWLKNTTKDGATTYNEVETFAEAPGFAVTEGTTLEVVTGTAMYKGGSVGVYVKNVLDDQANIVSATSGHFSADVDLTANFGGGDVKDNNQFTIGGMITGFVLQHGEANDWDVTLGLADFSGRPEDTDPGESGPGSTWTNTFIGVATGDSTAAPGSWNGMFHGVAGNVGEDPVVNTKPAAVTGEFNANFTDGTAAGGFGANIKK